MRGRAIRAVILAAVTAVSLSGCAADVVAASAAGGALDAQAATAGQAEVQAAKAAAARITLTQVAQAANAYAALNGGSTAGFAAQFSGSEAAVAAQLTALSDTSAQVQVAAGRCETVTLPAGSPADGPC